MFFIFFSKKARLRTQRLGRAWLGCDSSPPRTTSRSLTSGLRQERPPMPRSSLELVILVTNNMWCDCIAPQGPRGEACTLYSSYTGDTANGPRRQFGPRRTSQSGLSVTTGCQDPQDPIGTLTYIWDAPGAELATWPMAIFAV
eukprot:scaffold85272_cov72-Phaeocystis_antarctica.AAC.2